MTSHRDNFKLSNSMNFRKGFFRAKDYSDLLVNTELKLSILKVKLSYFNELNFIQGQKIYHPEQSFFTATNDFKYFKDDLEREKCFRCVPKLSNLIQKEVNFYFLKKNVFVNYTFRSPSARLIRLLILLDLRLD